TFEGYKIVFSRIVYRPYAVLTINKDPGGVIVLSGALIFMIALIGLLFMKGEDMELHSSFKNRVQINSDLK
ncbi:MAG: hypothetical protein V3S49_01655, partial [Thermodesulfobacteriota bacterium]